ncbi:MAG: rhomboid family intramembrane serine protease [Chloroflexi bacterium]|nr:rhomboid family intramembrane serine protease [Chloroflexota bacterium]
MQKAYSVKATIASVAVLIALMWVVGMVNALLDYRLSEYGVVPRTAEGLIGIPLMPFLHGSFDHLVVNTLPAVVLGGFVAIQGSRKFLTATVFITLVGGGALWVVGRTAVHVGASGLIFGYFGYLIARAWYTRSLASVLIAVVVAVVYGGILLGVLPFFQEGVSWEGHLTGLIAGGLAARLMWKEDGPEESDQD